MGKRPIKYKKHPIKGCYKMHKLDKARAKMLVDPQGERLRRHLDINGGMIYLEASRISGSSYKWLVYNTISSHKTREVLYQAAHNLIVRSKKYAR